jgi:hypothetical protein
LCTALGLGAGLRFPIGVATGLVRETVDDGGGRAKAGADADADADADIFEVDVGFGSGVAGGGLAAAVADADRVSSDLASLEAAPGSPPRMVAKASPRMTTRHTPIAIPSSKARVDLGGISTV